MVKTPRRAPNSDMGSGWRSARSFRENLGASPFVGHFCAYRDVSARRSRTPCITQGRSADKCGVEWIACRCVMPNTTSSALRWGPQARQIRVAPALFVFTRDGQSLRTTTTNLCRTEECLSDARSIVSAQAPAIPIQRLRMHASKSTSQTKREHEKHSGTRDSYRESRPPGRSTS